VGTLQPDLGRFKLSDDLEIGQSPNVPGLVPIGIQVRGDLVILDQLGWIPLPSQRLLQRYTGPTGSPGILMLACQSPSST
jgi:hypothetical protein